MLDAPASKFCKWRGLRVSAVGVAYLCVVSPVGAAGLPYSEGTRRISAANVVDQAESRSAVEVAYIECLDAMMRRTKGKMRVGSPVKSPGKIKIVVSEASETQTLVFVERENNGKRAFVVVGPEDAGAFRGYRLVRTSAGWKVSGIEDFDG